jgi:small nuclear ribonucleoprotein (snRNP)-like protein
MNITLREVYQTSADGDRFWKVKECYIRGSTVCLTFSPSRRKGTQF